jgi:hypothetical protein
VCFRIGYEDVAYFRNVFKRHTERGELAANDSKIPEPVRRAS